MGNNSRISGLVNPPKKRDFFKEKKERLQGTDAEPLTNFEIKAKKDLSQEQKERLINRSLDASSGEEYFSKDHHGLSSPSSRDNHSDESTS